MNKKIRKLIAASLATVMLVSSATILSACKSKNTKDRAVISEEAEWYDLTEIELVCPYDADEVSTVVYNNPVYLENYIYVLLTGEKAFDINESMTDPDFDYNQYIINSIYKYDLDGNLVDTIDIPNDSGNSIMEAQNLYEENGLLKISCLSADVDSDEINNRYVIVDPANGEVVDSYNSPVANSGMAMVENEISVGSKTLYSVYEYSGDEPAYTLIVAEGENREQTIDVNAVVGQTFWDISNFVVVDDNTVVMTAYGNDDPITLTLTLDNGNLVESNSVSALDEYYFTLTQDGLSCAVDSEGIWTVDENLNPVKSVDFSNTLLNVNDAMYSYGTYLDENMAVLFQTTYTSSIMPDSYIYILTKADSNPNVGKKILNVYSLHSNISYSEAEAICQFNGTNDEYFAVLTFADDDQFIDSEDKYEAINSISDQLMVDIMAGDGPDIVLNGAGVQQLNNSEYFLDLNEFINGEDGLDRNLYYTPIIDAATSADGALYQIPLVFGIDGILAKKDDVGEGRIGFTYQQYLDFVDTVCNGRSPITETNIEFLEMSIGSGTIAYNQNGTVDFDSEDFRALAEFALENIIEQPEFEDDNGMMYMGGYDSLENGAAEYEISSAQNYVFTAANIDGALGMYGMPFSTEIGACAEVYSSAAISALVEEEAQGAAWSFVKTMLSQDVQEGETYGIPMNVAANESLVNNALSVYNEQYYLLVSMGMNDMMLNMYGIALVPDSVADDYLAICNNVDRVMQGDTAVAAILTEEMGAYFSGQKTLDQVVGVLNDRAQTVVNERAAS